MSPHPESAPTVIPSAMTSASIWVCSVVRYTWLYCRITMDIIKAATVKEKKIMMEEDPLRLLIFCIRLQAFILRFVLIVLAPFIKDCL